MQELYERIYADPAFRAVQARRSRLCWILAAVMFFTYYAFISAIAFSPRLLATPLHGNTVITWGVPIGVSIIVLGIALTGYYVRRANTEFDVEVDAIVRRLGGDEHARGGSERG